MRNRWRSSRLAVVVVAVALLVSACGVRASVDVRVRDDGSGVVKVSVVADADAVKAVESGGAPIESAVRLTDLADAGWVVGTWVHPADGSASVVLTKKFGDSAGLASIVREISGAGGPLQGVRATRSGTITGTDYSVKGTIDLQHVKTGVPTDKKLVTNLSAQTVDVSKIDEQLLKQVESSFALDVVVRLPGQSPMTVTSQPGTITRINVASSVLDVQRLLLIAAALGFGVLAVVMWVRGGRRRRRRRPRTAPKQPMRPGARAPARGGPPRGAPPRGAPPRGAPPREGPARRPAGPASRPPQPHAPPPHGAPPHPDAPHAPSPTHAPPPAPHAPPSAPHAPPSAPHAPPSRPGPPRREPPPRRPGEPPRRPPPTR